MTKIALINPGTDERFAVQEPLNLGYIASYLEKNGIEVKIIDQLAGQDVEKELDMYAPDIVGLTAVTSLAPDAYRIAKMCREKKILTVMGGVHASVLPEEALQHVNVVVKGEGERAMLDVAKMGIKSGVVSRPYIENIDEIPPPSRHLMEMNFYMRTKDRLPHTYLYFVPPRTKTAAILTSRGCPYSCIFCHNTWRGMPFRFNSAERVLSEIKGLVRNHGVEAIFFIEDNLFVNKPRLRKICELLEKNHIGIMWGGNARVDNVDLETLRLAKEAGCRQITFGFESGSQRILDVLNKKTTVDQAKNAIKLCKQVGLLVNGTFIIGNPTETIEDIRATQRFIEENDIDSIGICIATPFPGTKLWSWCEEKNLIPESLDWADFTYDKMPILACDTILPKKLKKLYKETTDIAAQKVSLNMFHVLSMCLRHPGKSVIKFAKAAKRPSKIWQFIKRLKI